MKNNKKEENQKKNKREYYKFKIFDVPFKKRYIFKNLSCVFDNIKCFFLRGRYGFSPRDVWGLDSYFFIVIPGTLRYLADHAIGYPCPVPYSQKIAEKDDELHQNWIDKLNNLADKIENSNYEEIIHEFDMKNYKEYKEIYDQKQEQLKDAFRELAEIFPDLWD